MLNLILSIIFISVLGIIIFFIFFNYLLQKTFHIEHVESRTTPESMGFSAHEHFVPVEHKKHIQVWDLNPDKMAPIIIGVHGWANTAEVFLPLARDLSKQFRIILINTRNHGKSDDEKYSTILTYKEDILHTLNFVKQEISDQQPIFLLGHSLGAAACLLSAAGRVDISGIVSISAFADLEKMMKNNFAAKKLSALFMGTMLSYVEFRFGKRLIDLSPVKTIDKTEAPVVLVHGTKDEVVDYNNMKQISEGTKRPGISLESLENQNHSSLLKDQNLAHIINRFLENLIG